jgi:hypothetical protein
MLAQLVHVDNGDGAHTTNDYSKDQTVYAHHIDEDFSVLRHDGGKQSARNIGPIPSISHESLSFHTAICTKSESESLTLEVS